jgi:hypothetical protein
VVGPLILVMPGKILDQGNLPHKGAICMPVPCVGFSAGNPAFKGAKRRILNIPRTVMVLSNCMQGSFGALMIGYTITG